MEYVLQPNTLLDITPRFLGLLNLITYAIVSNSTSGIFEIRGYTCGTNSYQLITNSTYTNIGMLLFPGYCVNLYNPHKSTISVGYEWRFDSPMNVMLLVGLCLYILFLIYFCISCCFISSSCGRVIRRVCCPIATGG